MSVLSFWQSHQRELMVLISQHVLLVVLSTSIAVLVAVPLGIFAARRPRLSAPIVTIANVVQTVPSLAMFGFLLPVPVFGGVGARAAIVVLILYGLLPIVRTTIAGLKGIDRAVLEAGVAMGMTPRAAAAPGRDSAGASFDRRRDSRGGRCRRRLRDDRGCDRRRWSRRIHLPRSIDGRQHGHSRRCDPCGAARTRG